MTLRSQSATLNAVLSSFERAAKQFEETGFFIYSGPTYDQDESWHQRWKRHERQNPISQVQVRKIMKRVARELKRPIIVGETVYWDKLIRTTIQLKRTKKVAPVIAHFLLLELDPGYQKRDSLPIYRRQDGTNWYITFQGKEGDKLFKDWMQGVLTDPECRRALMLPPLAPDLKLAA